MRFKLVFAILVGFYAAFSSAWQHRSFRVATAIVATVGLLSIGGQGIGSLTMAYTKAVEVERRHQQLGELHSHYATELAKGAGERPLEQACAGKIHGGGPGTHAAIAQVSGSPPQLVYAHTYGRFELYRFGQWRSRSALWYFEDFFFDYPFFWSQLWRRGMPPDPADFAAIALTRPVGADLVSARVFDGHGELLCEGRAPLLPAAPDDLLLSMIERFPELGNPRRAQHVSQRISAFAPLCKLGGGGDCEHIARALSSFDPNSAMAE